MGPWTNPCFRVFSLRICFPLRENVHRECTDLRRIKIQRSDNHIHPSIHHSNQVEIISITPKQCLTPVWPPTSSGNDCYEFSHHSFVNSLTSYNENIQYVCFCVRALMLFPTYLRLAPINAYIMKPSFLCCWAVLKHRSTMVCLSILRWWTLECPFLVLYITNKGAINFIIHTLVCVCAHMCMWLYGFIRVLLPYVVTEEWNCWIIGISL